MTVREACRKAKEHSYRLANTSREERDEMLRLVADSLLDRKEEILAENAKDIADCTRPKQFIDRLRLDEKRLIGMREGILELTELPDPTGLILDRHTAKSGIRIEKVSVPFGVVAIIYEARPNVTADCIGLCLKSGNAVVLRGSRDAIRSNKAIVKGAKTALVSAGFDPECIQLVEDVSHEGAAELMRQKDLVDVLIPRGGASLIKNCVENSLVPVIETGTGNCHVYVEKNADFQMAVDIIENAKTSRPSVCNACESLVIDRAIAQEFLPKLADALLSAGVEIRGDAESCKIDGRIQPATDEDFYTEYLDNILSLKLVSGIEEAVDWINEHSTKHSEAIVTADEKSAEYFLKNVDSSSVYHNASTRFTDGFEFGLGAEMGISTQKLHARGPMGLRELTSYKYVVRGEGQIRK